MTSRILVFTVTNGTGNLRASGVYSTQITTNLLIPVQNKAEVREISSLVWDFQLPYTVLTTPRAGDYTFKMTAPLGGCFSNVLYASTNVPAVATGTQAGKFFMTEKRLDMSQDYFSDILWQRDDGHLGIWFMGKTVNKAVVDTNLNAGIYLDSLYQATGHKQFDLDWRIACQTDWDLNGMQDWVWQNTNSGKLRLWLLANTNFVDPQLADLNYHHYSRPLISTTVNPNDYTVTTNLTPTLITNIFTQTVTTYYTNFLSGPGLEVTTTIGDTVRTTNLLINLVTTNTSTTTITEVVTTTNNSGTIIHLTNTIAFSTNTFTTNSFLNFTLTNVTTVSVSGRTVYTTNVLVIPDLLDFKTTDIVANNVGGTGLDVTNTYTYTNYDNLFQYFSNVVVTSYADIVPGFFLVTYTTNYNITSSTNFYNPFISEISLDAQSPPDASTILVGCADFDNDRFPDFLFRRSDGRLFYETSFETFDEAYNNEDRYFDKSVNDDYSIAGVIDLNNDGWPDLLLQNVKNGATAIWFMKGTVNENSDYIYNRIRFGSLNGGAATPLKICGNADFNHDGQMDVLLRNPKTGQLIFWYLNGPRVIKTSIIDGPAKSWQIVGPR